MRVFISILLVPIMLAGGANAQPKDGDLILTSMIMACSWVPPMCGVTGVVDHLDVKTKTLKTLQVRAFSGVSIPRMAADNMGILVVLGNLSASTLVRIEPTGKSTTLASIPAYPAGDLDLDFDNTWIISGSQGPGPFPGPGTAKSEVFSYDGITVKKLFNGPDCMCPWVWNESPSITIDRDPGGSPYVLSLPQFVTTMSTPKLLGADRNGIRTTIVAGSGQPLLDLWNAELNPATGDYLTCAAQGYGGGAGSVCLVTKNGAVTTLSTAIGGVASRFNQDGTAWISAGNKVYRIDMQGAVLTVMPGTKSYSHALVGIEVYGSRRLVCRQLPATPRAVTVTVQSRHLQASGARYALAASFGRRPGFRFSNGEWLHLDTTDALFYLSALNLLSGTFVNFQGRLDQQGNATATVNIPAGLPKTYDRTVFVAGVIYEGANIIQVTNTHWFVL
jgi:hypothetical protein